jgi:hypothetical protein
MSGGRQIFRTLAIGVISLALVIGLTRLVTDMWALLAVALVLQVLLIWDWVWRYIGRLLTWRQQAAWDAEWDRGWAEQDAQPTHVAAPPRSAGVVMRASSQSLGIMAALSAVRTIVEQCQEWHIESIQVDTLDPTNRRYHLTVRHNRTGALQFLYTVQDVTLFIRQMRGNGQIIPQRGIGRGGDPTAR